MQEAVARRVEANPECFLARSRALPNPDGRFLSADVIKETFREYCELQESCA